MSFFGIPKGFLGWVSGGGTPIPPPPYAVFSQDGITNLSSLSGLNYEQGSGPSADSFPFYLLGEGLSPAADNITITPSGTDFEIFNPNDSTYYDTAFTVSYTGSSISLAGFKVRAKAGLSSALISGTFTITAPNTTPFILNCSGVIGAYQSIVAIGGTIIRDGNYLVHEIITNDNFIVLSNPNNQPLTWLGAAAGGAGGGTDNGGAGGGGGGDVLEGTFIPTVRTYAAVIGIGGVSSGINAGTNGGNTTFETESGTVTLLGGGGGGSGYALGSMGDGLSGGSGGGMGFNRPGITGLAIGLGFNGGATTGNAAGGGGGISSIGLSSATNAGGNGGNGLLSSISGLPKYYGAGGGGGGYNAGPGGIGGNNAGGNGGVGSSSPATNPISNSGSGGGGAGGDGTSNTFTGTNGADGIIIIRYFSPLSDYNFIYETILDNA